MSRNSSNDDDDNNEKSLFGRCIDWEIDGDDGSTFPCPANTPPLTLKFTVPRFGDDNKYNDAASRTPTVTNCDKQPKLVVVRASTTRTEKLQNTARHDWKYKRGKR